MIDLRNIFDVFIITNGRATFEYCHKAIQNQVGVMVNTHIIKDKKWVEANNIALSECISGRFLRVDDDMILHPKALLYISSAVQGMKPNVAMFLWKLWEPWNHRPVNGIKVYTKLCVTNMGGFRANKLGKIDKPFMRIMRRHRLAWAADKSLIGVHSCSSVEESIRYATMRGEHKGPNWGKKVGKINRGIGRYKGSLEDQYQIAVKRLKKINIRYNTGFSKFLTNE